MSQKKTFSCIKCGHPFDAYPPDDIHTVATRREGDYRDHIKIDYKCKNCGEVNTIYWGHPQPSISAV